MRDNKQNRVTYKTRRGGVTVVDPGGDKKVVKPKATPKPKPKEDE